MPGLTDHRSEVYIQRHHQIAPPSHTQALSGQRKSRVHRSGWSGECTGGEGIINSRHFHFYIINSTANSHTDGLRTRLPLK